MGVQRQDGLKLDPGLTQGKAPAGPSSTKEQGHYADVTLLQRLLSQSSSDLDPDFLCGFREELFRIRKQV